MDRVKIMKTQKKAVPPNWSFGYFLPKMDRVKLKPQRKPSHLIAPCHEQNGSKTVGESTGGKGNSGEIEEISYKFGAIYLWTVGLIGCLSNPT